MEVMLFTECRAKTTWDKKPGISVIGHCRNVGKVARALFERLNPHVKEIIGYDPSIVAAVHDVGKISPGFAMKYFKDHLAASCPDLVRMSGAGFEKDHTKIGAAAVNRFLNSMFSISPFAEIVGAHHGKGHANLPGSDEGTKFGGTLWAEERRKCIEQLVDEFGPFPDVKPGAVERNLVAGLVTVADWIGSDEDFFPAEGLSPETNLDDQAALAVEECGFQTPRFQTGLSFKEIFGFQPWPVQDAFIKCVDTPGLYILEAPMGEGKTEAALFAAYRLMQKGMNQGIYFGLPTRLTSEKIHERVGQFLEKVCGDKTPPKLVHGQAWLKAFRHGGEAMSAGRSWFDTRKRRLLYPFAVGTIDQALLSVLRVKHYFVRTFGLAGKVVILDEVHSYDVYTGSLMESMVCQLLQIGCTVIILSATLTGERRARLFSETAGMPQTCAYPLISFEQKGKTGAIPATAPKDRMYQVSIRDMDDREVAEIAVEKAGTGHCVVCIANTVSRAQNWYRAMASAMTQDAFPLGLLHSKFPMFQREKLEELWMGMLGKNGKRPDGCILVSTQVIEQSVDIDADFLVTEIAPTDMLLQRMGRQWRHPLKTRPCDAPETLVVSGNPESPDSMDSVIKAFGNSNCLVYAPFVLWRTYQVWKKKDRISLPSGIRELLEETYAEIRQDEPEAVRQLYDWLKECQKRLIRNAGAAGANVTSLGVMEDREEICTRYSEVKTIQALLLSSVDSLGNKAVIEPIDGRGRVVVEAGKPDFRITARLHENLVAIPEYQLKIIGPVKRPLWLKKHFYDDIAVLVHDSVTGKLLMDRNPAGFTYDSRLGLQRHGSAYAGGSGHIFTEGDEDIEVFDFTRFDW